MVIIEGLLVGIRSGKDLGQLVQLDHQPATKVWCIQRTQLWIVRISFEESHGLVQPVLGDPGKPKHQRWFKSRAWAGFALWARPSGPQSGKTKKAMKKRQRVWGNKTRYGCDARARAALRAIGAAPVLTAIKAKIPWRQLKVLGNQVKFQFILPSELEMKIAASSGNKPKAKTKIGKNSCKTFEPQCLGLRVNQGLRQTLG